jgi:hypothetical protein
MEVETIQLWLPYLGGGLIVPIIGQLKKTPLFNVVRPEFLKLILFALATWGLFAWIYPEFPVTFELVMDTAFQSVGVAVTLYGAKKAIT